jgi:hypothetical protein
MLCIPDWCSSFILTHPSIHTYSFIHACSQLFTHNQSTDRSIRLIILLQSINLIIHLLIKISFSSHPLIRLFILPAFHPSIHLLTHSLTHPLSLSFSHPSIHTYLDIKTFTAEVLSLQTWTDTFISLLYATSSMGQSCSWGGDRRLLS